MTAPIKDAQGNFLDSFLSTSVLFNVSFVSAEVGTFSNNEIVITLSQNIGSALNVNFADFAIAGVASNPTVNFFYLSLGQVKLGLSALVVSSDTPTVAFTATTTVLEDAVGNPLADFAAQQVLNNT